MIKISAPGRICLFGEHQDYLQLPVITVAINRRVEITATPRDDMKIVIDLPDINSQEILDISTDTELEYSAKRDYFKSVYNVLFRKGLRLKQGYDCTVRGKIPINSGTSSSSALNNVWCRFLLEVGDNVQAEWKAKAMTGHFSYLAEVEEFGEPGGKMDQLATAEGEVLHIDFSDDEMITKLAAKLGSFVLGDSQEPKDTMHILASTKAPALSAAEKIKTKLSNFNFTTFTLAQLAEFSYLLTATELTVMQGMLHNRNICQDALLEMQKSEIDHQKIGRLLTKHHRYLADNLKISTPKIERMLKAALDAGALGGKINGSGGGGCMFAYAPENPEKVAQAIESAGGKAYIIKVDEGLRVDEI